MDDVKVLVREYRAARQSGKGPDEAWAESKKGVQGVAPESFDGWRDHVVKVAEQDAPVSPGYGNILVRANALESENAELKRKLADSGARNEELEKRLAAAEELINRPEQKEAAPHKKK